MAAYDYYNNKRLPDPSAQRTPSPYAEGLGAPSTTGYPAPPPYASQNHLAPDRQQHSVSPISNSPFDTLFDDHVYPASSHASSQQHIPDTAYHGHNGLGSSSSGDLMHPAGGIPLQDRQGKDPNDFNDHVHERPKRKRTHKARFGELGMFGAAQAKRIPYVVYLFTVVQIAVFIGEIVRNAQLTGSPIMIHPQFNPMIGPSSYVLINMGARFSPCMHNVDGIQDSTVTIGWPCPNTTTDNGNDPSNQCTLSTLCGFGGIPEPFYNASATMNQDPQPNQWFRFIVPMFLHAGLIHIGFNLIVQLTIGREMEKAIGSIRFFLIYISAGIFGFVLGGNFAATGIASTGASGSLFGIIALNLLDLLYSWSDRRSPVKDLMFILLDIVISFVLGLLPGLDNFSHIGGFVTGLAVGISVLHSPNALRRRIGGEDPSYTSVNQGSSSPGGPSFFRQPIGFFKNRKPWWWAWWLIRAAAIVVVVIIFILLLNNFYFYRHTCGWCMYLSCLPVNNWCTMGNLKFDNNNGTTKRDVFMAGAKMASSLVL